MHFGILGWLLKQAAEENILTYSSGEHKVDKFRSSPDSIKVLIQEGKTTYKKTP